MRSPHFRAQGGEKESLARRALVADSKHASHSDDLFGRAYKELERIAARCLRLCPGEPGILPEALVHEAYLRLANSHQGDWNDDEHFCAHVTRVMRSVLIDRIRRLETEKRGAGWKREPSDFEEVPDDCSSGYFEVLDAMEALSTDSRRKAHVFCLRVFYDLTFAEIGVALGLAVATVAEHWAGAREWMRSH